MALAEPLLISELCAAAPPDFPGAGATRNPVQLLGAVNPYCAMLAEKAGQFDLSRHLGSARPLCCTASSVLT
jgi:hypothetical protein